SVSKLRRGPCRAKSAARAARLVLIRPKGLLDRHSLLTVELKLPNIGRVPRKKMTRTPPFAST
ncbi:MAG: hypothetical protein MUP44_04190, partial [Anaerolineales bacterium]|nr:hypothetical protein [Anaerolineales bacterium]